MRIDNTNSIIRPSPENPLPGSVALREGEGVSTAKATPAEGFAPTSDLAKLLQALRELPEVREEVVYDVKFRILSGELDGPDAAADAGEQIVA
jgi:hypothetical protein